MLLGTGRAVLRHRNCRVTIRPHPMSYSSLESTPEPSSGAVARQSLQRFFLYFVIAGFLVLLGSQLILTRHSGGSVERLMNIPTGGSAEYIDMAQHGTMAGPAPFRYRFLVPLIVSVLPVPAELGFRIVTFVCLGLTYVVALMTADALGISWRGSLIALFSVFCARTHAFNYWNPLLADGWGLLAMFVMLWALIRERDAIFTIASVLGTLGRESVMFLTPAIFTPKQWKRAVLPISLTAAAYLLPRILLRTPDQDIAHFYTQYHELPKFATVRFWESMAVSWSYLWLVLPVGTLFTPRTWWPLIWRTLGWAVLGTCIAVVMADDTERMVSYLTPFFFLAIGFLVDHACSLLLDITLLVLAPAHLLIMLATVPFPVHPHGILTGSLRLELLVVACLVTAASMLIGLREKPKRGTQ